MGITINHLNKYFDDIHVLQDIDLTIPTGSLTALLGPSGCGKTTLLRIIAGLEYADSGSLYFDDIDVLNKHVRDRKIGFMFQHYALFRHMNIFDNVAFGLGALPRKQRPSKAAITERVHELLKLVQLDWLAKAYPQQLSGGQRQRIALARALATEPKLLLLDEPFGALDAKVRKELRQWLRNIHHTLGITSILVTHDQEEALEMADQVVVMNTGKIEQIGSSHDLYQHPNSVFVTEFLGESNVFEQAYIEKGLLNIGFYQQTINKHHIERQDVLAYVRPHDLELSPIPIDNAIDEATVINHQIIGSQIHVYLKTKSSKQTTHVILSPSEARLLPLEIGQKLWLKPHQVTIFRLPDMVEYII